VFYVERSPRRVRVILGAETLADSTEVWLLHPPERTPTYLFPREHVRTATFEPSDRRRFDLLEPRQDAEAVHGLLSAGRVECSLDRSRHVA